MPSIGVIILKVKSRIAAARQVAFMRVVDMNIPSFKNQIYDKLSGLAHEDTVRFAWLCAVRALPFLGVEGNFNLWREGEQHKHLLSILRAIWVVGINDTTAVYNSALRVSIANRDFITADALATHAVLPACYAAEAAWIHVDNCSNASYYAAEAAHCAEYAASFCGIDITLILLQDLDTIKSGGRNFHKDTTIYGKVWSNFQKALSDIDCTYLGKWYAALFLSGLILSDEDEQKIRFLINMPTDIYFEGSNAVEEYLLGYKPHKTAASESTIAPCTIFLSYCSIDRDLADIICDYFDERHSIELKRYDSLPYKGSLKSFMQTLPEHDFVIMIVSNGFLESQACMYEVGELISDRNFANKLLFVIVDSEDVNYYKIAPTNSVGANIYNLEGRVQYTTYWETKLAKARESVAQIISDSAKVEHQSELREIQKIVDQDISPFLKYLSDTNGKSFGAMYKTDFQYILQEIKSKQNASNR